MTDCIWRKDALNKLLQYADQVDCTNTLGAMIGVILRDVPSADVRPVVLCKDCKYFYKESGKCLNIDGMAKQLAATDFCSCGVDMREVTDAT